MICTNGCHWVEFFLASHLLLYFLVSKSGAPYRSGVNGPWRVYLNKSHMYTYLLPQQFTQVESYQPFTSFNHLRISSCHKAAAPSVQLLILTLSMCPMLPCRTSHLRNSARYTRESSPWWVSIVVCACAYRARTSLYMSYRLTRTNCVAMFDRLIPKMRTEERGMTCVTAQREHAVKLMAFTWRLPVQEKLYCCLLASQATVTISDMRCQLAILLTSIPAPTTLDPRHRDSK